MKCNGCGYDAKDETDMLAHMTECAAKPEEKWETYLTVGPAEFKNSDLLKEE